MALVSGSDGLRSALAHPNTRQFLKFAAVGLASLAVEYAFLVYLLQSLNMNYLMATTISFIISIVFNYILSMKYVFVHKEDMSRRREFVIFSVLSAIGLGRAIWMIAGVISGRMIRRNVVTPLAPRSRAASSSRLSSPAIRGRRMRMA